MIYNKFRASSKYIESYILYVSRITFILLSMDIAKVLASLADRIQMSTTVFELILGRIELQDWSITNSTLLPIENPEVLL